MTTSNTTATTATPPSAHKTGAETETAMRKAKVALMSRADSAFFMTIAFSLHHEFTERVPTAATNGRKILYNPDFFMKLSTEERVFLILHESMHCAYLHMSRRNDRQPMLWNVAADHVINLQLLERGFTMPANGLADERFKSMSTDEVYKTLLSEQIQNQNQNPQNPGDSPGPPGSGSPPANPPQTVPGFGADLLDPEEVPASKEGGGNKEGKPVSAHEALSEEIEDILIRAAIQSRAAGDSPGVIPGDIQIYLDRLLNPRLPWQRILHKYLQSFAKNDYTFARPNRRFFPTHYMPAMQSASLIDLAVAIDTSGSVSDEEFQQFIGEIAGIFKMMTPQKITLIQFDTELKSVDQVRSVPELQRVKFSGRGGTCIGPVIEWANKHKPQLLLTFTDGHFYDDREPLNKATDLIWLIHDNPGFTSDTGKVIHYEV